jgi:hypothetical protein
MLGPGPRDHSSEPDRGAPFAFHLGADIAHDAIHGDGITPFVELLDHDIALVGFHRDRPPPRIGQHPAMQFPRRALQNRLINDLVGEIRPVV